MKRLLNVIVLLLSCVSIMKAEQLVATLQSGDATKAFYGYSAIVEAYNEASDGDIITLSKGNFENVTIEKAITLRGAGAFVEGHSTTINDLTVNADYAIIEGIYVTNKLLIKGNNQQLLRCNVKILNSDNGTEYEGETSDPSTYYTFIADCAINTDGLAFNCVDAIYKNCRIGGHAGPIYSEGSATYDHCIVGVTAANLGWDRFDMYRHGYFYNCILVWGGNYPAHYLSIYAPNQFFDTILYVHDYIDITLGVGIQMENFIISHLSDDEYAEKFESDPYFFFEEVPATDVNSAFICGVVDHKEWPAIPRVIESNIDKETDASGHLKVEVKVSCER